MNPQNQDEDRLAVKNPLVFFGMLLESLQNHVKIHLGGLGTMIAKIDEFCE